MTPEAEVPQINWDRGISSAGYSREGNIDAPFDNWSDPKGGGGAPAVTHAFQMTNASVGATLKVSIRQGTVNGVYPTGMNATTPKEITITATTTFYLKVVGTFGAPDTYAVTIETTAVTESITGTGFVSGYAIGTATVASGAIVSPMDQLVTKSMGVESAGSENMWW